MPPGKGQARNLEGTAALELVFNNIDAPGAGGAPIGFVFDDGLPLVDSNSLDGVIGKRGQHHGGCAGRAALNGSGENVTGAEGVFFRIG